jgi:hypothetical protein
VEHEDSGTLVDDPGSTGGVLDTPAGFENNVQAPITASTPNGKTKSPMPRVQSPAAMARPLPEEIEKRSTVAMLMAAAYIVGGSYAVIFGARVLWAELHKEK